MLLHQPVSLRKQFCTYVALSLPVITPKGGPRVWHAQHVELTHLKQASVLAPQWAFLSEGGAGHRKSKSYRSMNSVGC